jgi:hypothetical protein
MLERTAAAAAKTASARPDPAPESVRQTPKPSASELKRAAEMLERAAAAAAETALARPDRAPERSRRAPDSLALRSSQPTIAAHTATSPKELGLDKPYPSFAMPKGTPARQDAPIRYPMRGHDMNTDECSCSNPHACHLCCLSRARERRRRRVNGLLFPSSDGHGLGAGPALRSASLAKLLHSSLTGLSESAIAGLAVTAAAALATLDHEADTEFEGVNKRAEDRRAPHRAPRRRNS